MKLKFVLFLCCAVAAGCQGPILLGPVYADGELGPADGSDEVTGDIVQEPEDTVIVRRSLYITGVEYPEGFEWRGDIGSDASGSMLFLMRDGERIVEIPVGYDRCVSVDADMHRCIDGHLYTDFSTSDETVIGRDGRELFRYAGREMIAGMLVYGGSVYTLGVPRSGTGWTFRRDGQTILSRSEGGPVGGLYMDGESVVFSFREPSADGGDKYYIVNNGLAAMMSLEPDISCMDDVRLVDGDVNCVASVTGITGEWLFTGGVWTRLDRSGSYTMYNDLRIRCGVEDLIVTGSLGDGTGIWRGAGLERRLDGKLRGMALAEDRYVCITGSGSAAPDGIFLDGEMLEWPYGYDFLYEGCVAVDEDRCAVGMVDRTRDNRPALWIDGEIMEYDFNGFFTALEYLYPPD